MKGPLCRLEKTDEGFIYQAARIDRIGKLIPKDGKIYRILLETDNPDINSITTELKIIRQAVLEYSKRLPYSIKVYSELKFPLNTVDVDVNVKFIEPDQYMTDNTLAYAGYPFGSLRGQIRFNNKFIWLDGYPINGKKALKLGIVDMADPNSSLGTYNIRQTFKHEFGHSLGLEHNAIDAGAVMQPMYDFENTMLGPTSEEVLKEKYGLRSLSSRWLWYITHVMQRRIRY